MGPFKNFIENLRLKERSIYLEEEKACENRFFKPEICMQSTKKEVSKELKRRVKVVEVEEFLHKRKWR